MRFPQAILLLLLAAVPAAAQDAAAPSVDAVLAADRVASGGDARAGRTSLRVVYAYDGQGLTGQVTALTDLTTGRYVDVETAGPAKQVEGYDGEKAWVQDPSGAIAIQTGGDAPALAVNEAYRRANLWWRPDRGGAAIVARGEQTDGARTFDVLAVTPKNGKTFDAWFDARTHFLARVVEAQGPETVTTDFSDYRAVDGAPAPFRIVIRHGDPKFDEHLTVQSAAFEAAPPADAFAAPSSGPPDHGFVDGGKSTTVPFRLANNHIYAQVSLNGRPFEFLFDSGGQNVITPQTARTLHLSVTGSLEGGGAGENHVAFGLTKIDRIGIGAAFVKSQVFPVVALDEMTKVEGVTQHGIIGYETFRRFVTRIDYGARTITLIDPHRFDPATAGVAVPFRIDGTNIIVAARIDGQDGGFILDTGSRGSVTLATAFAKAHGFDPDRVAGVRGVTGWGFGGVSRGVALRPASFSIGPFVLQRPVVDLSTDTGGAFADPSIAGNIGGGVLKRFVVTLDYDHATLYLKPVRGPIADLDTFDRAGLWINRSPAGYKVVEAIAGAPAAEAGLQAGDDIIAVNGISARRLSLDATRRLLRTRPPGAVVVLQVRRNNHLKIVRIRLRDLL